MKRLASLAVVCAIAGCSNKARDSARWLTEPDLATHSALYFPIAPGDAHGPAAGQQQVTTCNQCHADRSSGSTPYPPATSFKTFTCTGCHVEVQAGVFHDDIAGLATFADHAGQAAFDPTQPLAFDQACRRCHPDGSGATPPPYHGQLFPIDSASKHAAIGCSSCHGATRSDLTQLKCASCHADQSKSPNFPTQHTVTGVAILFVTNTPSTPGVCPATALPTPANPVIATDDPRVCLQCHARSDPVPVAAHPTTNSTFGTGRHQGAGCFTCHVSKTQVTATVTPPTPAPSGYPTVDFTQPANPSRTSTPGCTNCHNNGCGGN